MDIFDSAIERARELLDFASRQTMSAVELSKMRLQLAQLRSEVKKGYERMGRLWYEQEKGEADNIELLSACAADLDALLVEVAEIETLLSNARNELICPKCGAANASGALYCQRCGASFEKESIFEDFDSGK